MTEEVEAILIFALYMVIDYLSRLKAPQTQKYLTLGAVALN